LAAAESALLTNTGQVIKEQGGYTGSWWPFFGGGGALFPAVLKPGHRSVVIPPTLVDNSQQKSRIVSDSATLLGSL